MQKQQPQYVAFVDCDGGEPREDPEAHGCGTQGLTQEQYAGQLGNPWATWRCPCCGGEAFFNDELSEAALGITSSEEQNWPSPIGI